MCMLCVEFNKGKMTIREAKNNLQELVNSQEGMTEEEWLHLMDLYWSEDLEAALNEEANE